jgi:hypothetical protein
VGEASTLGELTELLWTIELRPIGAWTIGENRSSETQLENWKVAFVGKDDRLTLMRAYVWRKSGLLGLCREQHEVEKREV